MSDQPSPPLLAELARLPEPARRRASAIMEDASSWAGDLLAVDALQVPEGLRVTLRFEQGAFDFVTPAASHDD